MAVFCPLKVLEATDGYWPSVTEDRSVKSGEATAMLSLLIAACELVDL